MTSTMTVDKTIEKKREINDVKNDQDLDHEMLCGAGLFYPSWLQRCGNTMSYSVCYGLTMLVTNALSVYISSQITTLEKQFHLSSSQSGFILSCNDIGFISTVLFISHFGIRYHIPRILSLFTVIYGLSGIATSSIQLLSNPDLSLDGEMENTQTNNSINILCISNPNKTSTCAETGINDSTSSTSGLQVVFVLLCVFMGIQGIGKAPRSSLGTYYIDSNVQEKTRTGFYLGISTTLGLFGPFFAITLGGLFGKVPVDLKGNNILTIYVLKLTLWIVLLWVFVYYPCFQTASCETTITPKDPRWIGAWWIGFLLFGILAIIVALPLAFYPRRMIPKIEKEKTENQQNSREIDTCCSVVKDIPKAIFRVLRTPVYPIVVLALGIFLFGVMGGISFGPKYMENQFNIPTWQANIILGAEKLVTATLGTFMGGYLTSKLKLSRQGCIKMIIIIMFITTSLNSLNYIFGCENPSIYGKDTSSPARCDCDSVTFMAVCDDQKRTYYSPCHAGCTNSTSNTFGGCSKVNDDSVTVGLCDSDCKLFIPYIAVQVINTLFGTLSIMPVYLVILRSLDEKDRSIALGVQSFLYALVVHIPAPIVFGQLFDSFCIEWNSSCGEQGSCALYNIETMRYTLTSIEVGSRLLVFILYIFIFYAAKRDDAKNHNSSTKYDIELKVESPTTTT